MIQCIQISTRTFATCVACLTTLLAIGFIAGCSGGESAATEPDNPASAVDTAQFLLDTEPDGANSVLQTRESSSDGDPIVLVGRIGGSTHPWVNGAAAFTVVDESLPACGDSEDCGCPTPWDYCCETSETLATHTATIKFVDDANRTLRFDAKQAFGIAELQFVVVQGTAKRDDAGNLTVLAEKMFVRK